MEVKKFACSSAIAIILLLILILFLLLRHPSGGGGGVGPIGPIERQNDSSTTFTSQQQQHLLDRIKAEAAAASLPNSSLEKIGKKFDEDDDVVCYDIECLESALEIMAAINLSVNPCEPGKWLDFVCERSGRQQASSQLTMVKDSPKRDTIALLLEETNPINNNKFLLKDAQTYFRQCTSSRRGRQTQRNLADILEFTEKYGGWPILANKTPEESSSSSSYPYPSWMDYVADQNQFQMFSFIPLFLDVDAYTSGSAEDGDGTLRIRLDVGRANLRGQLSTLSRMIKEGKLGRVAVMNITELEADVNSLDEELHLDTLVPIRLKAVRLFRTLHSVQQPSTWDNQTETVTLQQLQHLTDAHLSSKKGLNPARVNWSYFLQRVFHGTTTSPGGKEEIISLSTKISLPLEKVMKVVEWVERKMGEPRGRRQVLNVLQLNVVSMLIQETTTLADDDEMGSTQADDNNDSNCLGKTKLVFGSLLEKYYLERHFNNPLIEPQVRHLIDAIKASYAMESSRLPWMGLASEASSFVRDSLKRVQFQIGQPGWMRGPGKLEELFKGLEGSVREEDSFVGNFLRVNSWRRTTPILSEQEVDMVIGMNSFTKDPTIENAYPNITTYLSVAFMSKPIFGLNRPGFMDFGGLGTLVARKVGRIIYWDPIMAYVFKVDNEEVLGSWDPASFQMFKKWATDIDEFYKSIPPNNGIKSGRGIKLDDDDPTIRDHLEDILSLQAGFDAYQHYLSELDGASGKREMVLPGLESFSPQQLFFIKYANMWCESDKQSPSSRRADLPLRLSHSFQSSFGCTANN